MENGLVQDVSPQFSVSSEEIEVVLIIIRDKPVESLNGMVDDGCYA
jgi:hypothetical protein